MSFKSKTYPVGFTLNGKHLWEIPGPARQPGNWPSSDTPARRASSSTKRTDREEQPVGRKWTTVAVKTLRVIGRLVPLCTLDVLDGT